jgi:carotenoid cleavage dioxygenase-like enzyme
MPFLKFPSFLSFRRLGLLYREIGPLPLQVQGHIPAELRGEFVKNGPNAVYPPGEGRPFHWFDGDGMLHGVEITDQGVTYRNRWVRTKRFTKQVEEGPDSAVYGKNQLSPFCIYIYIYACVCECVCL